ncbi:MAG TPA: extracellular solute-binding protein, partial [Ktedonobacteraceae bacterium]|nr:extracellular solute-binding protein [Ktedonobacteraceae bacterium]
KNHPEYGYVWQGAQYEGLVCNFDEVLHGYGGSLFSDPFHPTVVTVDSPQARQALTTMVNWINKISPDDTDTYTEEVTRNTWEKGEALFMRNWPYAYSHSQQTTLAHKFGIHPMLSGGINTIGHSSLGGWQLAINAFIDPVKQDAAWEFIQYMLQPEAQKIGATVASWVMTLMSIYEDQEILSKFPFYKQLKPILQAAVPRPVTPNYTDMSTAIVFHVRQALARQASVSETLKALAAKLEQLINSNQVS